MTTTTTSLTTEQFCSQTFDVLKDGVKVGIYLYRVEIGGGDWSYAAKRGMSCDHKDGSTIKAGFDSRKEALAWLERNDWV